MNYYKEKTPIVQAIQFKYNDLSIKAARDFVFPYGMQNLRNPEAFRLCELNWDGSCSERNLPYFNGGNFMEGAWIFKYVNKGELYVYTMNDIDFKNQYELIQCLS